MFDLIASDFDTVLSLQTPAGELLENDDFQGSTDQSQIQLTLQESGALSYFGVILHEWRNW